MADINPFYTPKVLNEAHQHFAEQKTIQLLNILTSDALALLANLSFEERSDPLTHRYIISKAPSFIARKEFAMVLARLAGYPVKIVDAKTYSFGPGDYTVLTDKMTPGKGIAFFLEFFDCDESNGGYTSFVNGGEELARVVGKANTLMLVEQTGMRSFVKYVNHRAQNKRVFVHGILLPK